MNAMSRCRVVKRDARREDGGCSMHAEAGLFREIFVQWLCDVRNIGGLRI